MRKKLTAILTAVLTALFCVSCTNVFEETTNITTSFTPRLNTEEEVTLNIIGCMANFESLEAIITDFENYYPNCEVLYTPITSSGEYWSLFESRIKSDNSIDMFMIKESIYSSGAVKEICMDLSKEDIDLSAIQPEVISSSTVDGKLYQIPLMHNSSGLIVNKSILQEQNLDIPTNYGEFLEVCEKLKQAGYIPLQGAAFSSDECLMHAMSYVIMNNTFKDTKQEDLAAINAGKPGSAQILQPIFDILDTLYKKGYINREINETYADGYNDAILKFFEGDVPFLIGKTETLSGMKKRESKSEHFTEEPFEYIYMTTPFAQDGAYCYLENWYGLSINENCVNKEWAVEFLRFLMTNEEINKLAYLKGLPSVATESDDDRFIGLYNDNNDYFCTSDTFFPANVQEALYVVEMNLVEGKITADEATSEMERRLREDDFSE